MIDHGFLKAERPLAQHSTRLAVRAPAPEELALSLAEAATRLEKALADDMRCPRKILIRNDCRLLDSVSPRALDNANTPEDWATATAP